jgi:hypothetical protein
MKRTPILVLLVLISMSSCVGVHLVPVEQAARDLGCPVGQVRIETFEKNRGGGTATGCGKVLDYREVCSDEERKSCHFEHDRARPAPGMSPRGLGLQ